MKRFIRIVTALTGAAVLSVPAAASASTPAAAPSSTQRAAASCGSYLAVYGPLGGGWSRTYKGTCGHVDIQAKPQHWVSWSVGVFSSGQMCVRARGYRWSDGKEYWTSLGCGKGGGGYVHWGKVGGPDVMSVNAVQGKSMNIVLGVPGYFSN